MADNITIKNGSGTSVVLGAKDLSSVFLMKHCLVDDAGDIAQVGDVDGALDERVDGFLLTASCMMGIDSAASAGSQLVPVEVESTASPNLRVAVYNGETKLFDAAARAGYVALTDGTDTAAINDVDGALDERTDGYLQAAAALMAIDSAASAGSQLVPLKVESTAQPNLRVAVMNGANQQPAGDTIGRAIFTTPGPATTTGLSKGTKTNLNSTVHVVKASAGVLHKLIVTNGDDDAAYIQIFDSADGTTGITLGTTVPDLEFLVPASSTQSVVIDLGPYGVAMANGIAAYSTKSSVGSTGNDNGVKVRFLYK